MGKLHIKNYREYLKRLKENFNNIQQMPSDDEVRVFISEYNLDSDWKIDMAEVKQDIRSQILYSKTTIDKQKRISSYKEYLVKLKAVFGIPEIMPKDSEIEDFISKFGLKKNWGITVKDVSEDLEKFINGKYDELYKDAIRRKKSSAHQSIGQSYTYVPLVQKQAPVSRPSDYHISKPVKQKESKSRKTIFIDADNHFDEGKKGIEHTTKDTTVRVIFSQPGAKKKFDKEYGRRPNVSSQLVQQGPQAVDNQIKTEVEQLLEEGNQDITIVSQDKGFKKYIDKNKKKNNKSGNKISTAKSVKEALKKN